MATMVETARTPLPWWKEPTKDQWLAWVAAWLGWTLDSFDFTIFLLHLGDVGVITERVREVARLFRVRSDQDGGETAPILTAKYVVRPIAAQCAYVDDRGAIGIRPQPAAAIVRHHGGQTWAPGRGRMRWSPKPL